MPPQKEIVWSGTDKSGRTVEVIRNTGIGGRFYTRKVTESRQDGSSFAWEERVHSVTSILGAGIPKPAIVYWAVNEATDYVVQGIDELLPILRSDPEAARDVIKRSPWRKRDKAADFGSLMHNIMEAEALGQPMPPVPPEAEKHVANFHDWWKTVKPEPIAVEVTVWHDTEQYAGTTDLIAKVDGKTAIIDYKTTQSKPGRKSGGYLFPETVLQLCAYARATEFMPKGLPGQPMPNIDTAYAVSIRDDGWEMQEADISDEVWNYFRYAREVARWQWEAGKDAYVNHLEGRAA